MKKVIKESLEDISTLPDYMKEDKVCDCGMIIGHTPHCIIFKQDTPKREDWIDSFEEKREIIHNDLVFGDGEYTKSFISQLLKSEREKAYQEGYNEKEKELDDHEEAYYSHPSADEYCCACDYDIDTMEQRIKQSKAELIKQIKEWINKHKFELGSKEMMGGVAGYVLYEDLINFINSIK